ncbi:type II toxin-antitoxin system RelE/ParE family toxin [Microbacterium protaetiae]|uniref:Type II toxin-antitoxin system RelE/ParE family toxin n=1 Tax=Microbacterium protaetiae TaxID=2509458 RepID=A0A4P6EB56_9MICO|nr:type II toxin-antitoxin system RelE/ParE family toxin [Microbacterium protaetiae]
MTLYRLRVSATARADVREALQYSAFRFGGTAMQRYADLIEQALTDIRADPFDTGSSARSDLGADVRVRHLKASAATSGVADPRHIVFYRVNGTVVDVLRILHEMRDAPRHLP